MPLPIRGLQKFGEMETACILVQHEVKWLRGNQPFIPAFWHQDSHLAHVHLNKSVPHRQDLAGQRFRNSHSSASAIGLSPASLFLLCLTMILCHHLSLNLITSTFLAPLFATDGSTLLGEALNHTLSSQTITPWMERHFSVKESNPLPGASFKVSFPSPIKFLRTKHPSQGLEWGPWTPCSYAQLLTSESKSPVSTLISHQEPMILPQKANVGKGICYWVFWEDLREREAQVWKAEAKRVWKCVWADCWIRERLGTVSKDTAFRGQQLCKLTQLHQNDSWFQHQFFIRRRETHAVPFKAYRVDTVEQYYPHAEKKKTPKKQ